MIRSGDDESPTTDTTPPAPDAKPSAEREMAAAPERTDGEPPAPPEPRPAKTPSSGFGSFER